ncbi:uncharacterized protein F4822DRAFT_236027 [Hypoxylon trugodes]|uniref:uncharacterized protein n=1 Tax=Hypoxylon trugodes TaxID=326681 RepID=UPI002193D8FB|nr:uncharacterized protein F4822DRAFT_236027 [Hypoxylon trugodes]KAI1390431.1 hypothetical protein F4822DRAFT_236027 [Hypoxylon trugodes]
MQPKPYILAETHISATILSFTSGPEPQLKLTLTLVGAQQPITISKEYYQLFTPSNAFIISGVPSGRKIYTLFVDINHRLGPPLHLDAEHADRFLTLEPGIPCEIHNFSFRPLGSERNSQKAALAPEDDNNKYRGYKFLRLGMNWLEPGDEYLISARPGLQIGTWRRGRKEELMPCAWNTSDGDPLDVVPTEGIRVRIEE